LLFEKETYRIIGAAMEVHRVMGPGFLEAVYQECLALECGLREIPYLEEPRLQLEYKGQAIQKCYYTDFVMFGIVVVEIKAVSKCGPNDEAQILNAIIAAEKPVGLLMSFGEASLFWQRFANTERKSATSAKSAV